MRQKGAARGKLAALISALLFLLWAAPASSNIPPSEITQTVTPAHQLRFHHLRRMQPAVATLERRGPRVFERVAGSLGVDEFPTVDVWVLPRVRDYFDFHDRIDVAPDWAVGLSFSGQRTIVVAAGGERPPLEVMRTFAHELAHVGVDIARGQAAVPRWFHEGFAVMMADEWTPERSELLSRAAAGGQLSSFAQLTRDFPAHHASASVAYNQSYHFVRWLQRRHGPDFFARVFDRVGEGLAFEAAVEAEAGQPLASLESTWREGLSEGVTAWSILREENLIFFGAGLLFIIAYVVARRRRRERFEAMESDAAEDALWDYDEARYPLPGQAD